MEEKQMIKQTKYGWVDLSNLIYHSSGSIVDWSKSIGQTVDFQYDNIMSTLTVTGRADDAQYVYIDIPEYAQHRKIYIGQIIHGQLGSAVKRITSDFKYEVGDIVVGLLITGRHKTPGHKYYTYTCTVDGYQGRIREDHLTTGHGCPVCKNKAVFVGYNDIATTNPYMANLFYNIDDAVRYTEGANKYADFQCPRCGNKIHALIRFVSGKGLSCKKCGDGISYPNKFVYNFMEQLVMLYNRRNDTCAFTPEKRFSWAMNFQHANKKLSGKKIYDIFIDTHNIIIENHGDYHYKNNFACIDGALSLEEVQENDSIKHNLAIANNIADERYVILDCSKSDMQHIKNSIMSSNLPTLLDFTESDIDWKRCDEFATSSRVYEACCYWNQGVQNYKEIAAIMHMHRDTIQRYIKKGRELNIIND